MTGETSLSVLHGAALTERQIDLVHVALSEACAAADVAHHHNLGLMPPGAPVSQMAAPMVRSLAVAVRVGLPHVSVLTALTCLQLRQRAVVKLITPGNPAAGVLARPTVRAHAVTSRAALKHARS